MPTPDHLRHHIVILGAGFGGLAAALELERLREFSKTPYNVTVIDQNCFHLYHALLYEIATARNMVRPEDLEALRRGVCIRIKALDDIFLRHQIFTIQDVVTTIDRSERKIMLESGAPIHYDDLIVGLGSVSSDFGIPGLKEHSLVMKTLSDALDINLKLHELIGRLKSGQGGTILVGGGGISGVETAGELQHYLNRLHESEGLDISKCKVMLIEAGPTILMGFGEWAQKTTTKRLEDLGVEIKTGQPITAVEATSLTLKDSTNLSFDLFLWNGGIQAHPLLQQLGGAPDTKGRVRVTPTLNAVNDERVWVIGDAAMFFDPVANRPLPQVAPEAVGMGMTSASNVVARVNGKSQQPYQPKRSGFVFPVGGRWAISTMWGWKTSGTLAWLIRKWVDWRYFLSVLTFRNAWQVFWTGGKIYLRND